MIDDAFDLSGSPPKPLSVKEGRQLDVILSRRVEPEERDRLERILLNRIKSRKEDLHKMLVMMSDHWTYRIFIILLLLASPLVAWRMYLSHFINQRLKEIRAAGLPTNGEELNRYYPAVPDDQNAALALTRVFELRRNFLDSRSNLVFNFKLPKRGAPLSAEQVELLKDYVAMNSAMVVEADKALDLPASRYPVDCTRLLNTPLPHLARLKNLTELYQYAAFLAMQSGRLDRAS